MIGGVNPLKKVVLSLAVIVAIFAPSICRAQTYPDYGNYVNDFAGVIDASTVTELNAILASYDKSSSNQIAVATVNSLQGVTIEEYAVKLFEKWKIGQKGKDNGILVLVSTGDKQVRIEVGYGLEGDVPDSTAGTIIRDDMTPQFAAGKYGEGVKAGVVALIKKISPDFDTSNISVTPVGPTKQVDYGALTYLFMFLFFAIIRVMSKSKSWWFGGVLGYVAGAIVAYVFLKSILLALLLIGPAIGGVGLGIDYLASKYIKPGSGGGFWFFGGGSGFGGSGGGGFGGFGGGRSGGGGASGGW